MRLCQALYLYRETLNLSIRSASKEIGVSHSVLDRFERGGQVEARQWVKIFLWLVDEPTVAQMQLIKNPQGKYAEGA
jgi:transcriptional regulator with XRE-family HTH domain